jgi:hypothetical protein
MSNRLKLWLSIGFTVFRVIIILYFGYRFFSARLVDFSLLIDPLKMYEESQLFNQALVQGVFLSFMVHVEWLKRYDWKSATEALVMSLLALISGSYLSFMIFGFFGSLTQQREAVVTVSVIMTIVMAFSALMSVCLALRSEIRPNSRKIHPNKNRVELLEEQVEHLRRENEELRREGEKRKNDEVEPVYIIGADGEVLEVVDDTSPLYKGVQ